MTDKNPDTDKKETAAAADAREELAQLQKEFDDLKRLLNNTQEVVCDIVELIDNMNPTADEMRGRVPAVSQAQALHIQRRGAQERFTVRA